MLVMTLYTAGLLVVLAGIYAAMRHGNVGNLLVAAGNLLLMAFNLLQESTGFAVFHAAVAAFSLAAWLVLTRREAR